MAKTVTVELTLKDTQILRRLIIEEAKRFGYNDYQRPKEFTARLRRLNTVAAKIWEARQSFDV